MTIVALNGSAGGKGELHGSSLIDFYRALKMAAPRFTPFNSKILPSHIAMRV